MATGAFSGKKSSDGNGAGGMSTKISPAAVLIIQNGATRLINVKNQDAVTRVMDLVPDVINRFTANSKISPEERSGLHKFLRKKRAKRIKKPPG